MAIIKVKARAQIPKIIFILQISLVVILAITLSAQFAQAQKIPSNSNKTDANGKRQGNWTILFDNDWAITSDTSAVSYYRVITYKDDKPTGLVHDYYRSGNLQFTGTLAEDRPKEIFDGNTIWFNRDGLKESETVFSDGQQVGDSRVFYTDGSVIEDSFQALNELGLNLLNEGKSKEALPFFEKAFIRARNEFDKQSDAYTAALEILASLYFSAGNYSKAEPFFVELKELRAKVLGKENANYAATTNSLAQVYHYLSNYSKAEPLYVEAIEIKAKVSGKDNVDYANTVNSLANLYYSTGNYLKAEPLYLEIKEIRFKILGMTHADYLKSLDDLASLYDAMGNYLKEEPLDLEKIEIQAKVLGKEHPDYAASVNELAVLYKNMGRYSKAETLYLESIQIRKKVLGQDHPDYASSLNNLATLYSEMGNYSKAEALYLASAEIRGRVLGKEHRQYAASLSNLGALYYAIGNFSKAEALYLESKEIRAKVLGKEHSDYAFSLNNLASLYSEMGNHSKAEPLYHEAIEIMARVNGKEHPNYAVALNNLALHYYNIGNYPKAEPLWIEVKEIREKVLGKDHPDFASTLNNLAGLYSAMGNYSKAVPLYQEANEIQARVLGKEHEAYANTENNLGLLYQRLGDFSKAERLILESTKIRKKVLGKEHPDYVASMNNLAMLYEMMGDLSKAEPLYLEATSQQRQQIVRYFPSLSEKEKQDYYSTNQFYFSNFESFCMNRFTKNPTILSELYNLRLATKGLLFNTSNKMRQRILSSGNQTLIQRFSEWQSKKDFLAKVYQMPLNEKLEKGLDEIKLEEEANTIEKELSLKSELLANETGSKLDRWEDVRQKLKEGEVCIEIIRTKKVIENKYVVAYAALIITSQTQTHPDIVVLENGADLEGKFSKYYRNTVKQKIKDEISYNQYWKPIANKIKGAKKVYFSADGVYNQINLNTLYNPATGKYVIDEIEVQLVTSTKDLLVQNKPTKTEIIDATFFGYPNYNNSKTAKTSNSSALLGAVVAKTLEIKSDTSQRFFDGENISELPGTKVEVQTIEALLKKKNIATHEYMFDQATEAEIKKLKNPQLLHVATHGFFLSDVSESKENERGFAGMETKKIIENPLLRSGLLFAGVKNSFSNNGTPKDASAEDGILTAYEAMNLNLDQTDLVVMSACETGLGVTSNGEGVYGLQRAFQVAGAKSVLMSLWTVSDEATQQLMTMFYENWLGGKTPREAFRLAQLSLREKFPEPYYWGAFVLIGN